MFRNTRTLVLSSHARGLRSWLCKYQLFSTPGASLSKTHLLTLAHKDCGRPPVMRYNFLWFQPYAVHVTCNAYDANGSLHWDSHQSCVLQTVAHICTVPMANAIATGKVCCYNFIVHLHSLPQFVESISQGYCSAALWPLACEDAWLLRLTVGCSNHCATALRLGLSESSWTHFGFTMTLVTESGGDWK